VQGFYARYAVLMRRDMIADTRRLDGLLAENQKRITRGGRGG